MGRRLPPIPFSSIAGPFPAQVPFLQDAGVFTGVALMVVTTIVDTKVVGVD